jgi:cbb3-type cytochrome oxidase subunit 3
MRDEALSQFPGGAWTAAAMVIFFVLFIVFVLWTYRKSGREFYKRMARMPFDGRDNDE